MRGRFNLSIGVKLPLIMCAMVGLALVITLFFEMRAARAAINSFANDRLMVLAQVRADRLEQWSAEKATRIGEAAADPSILLAFRAFRNAWYGEEDKPALRAAYLAAANTGDVIESQSDYALMHARYHQVFESMAQAQPILDVHLISADGHYLYSYSKGPVIGKTVTETGAGSIGRAWKGAMDGPDGGTHFVPLSSQSAGPIGAGRITNRSGAALGVLVVELKNDPVLAILSDREHIGDLGHASLSKDGEDVISTGTDTTGLQVHRVETPVVISGQKFMLKLGQVASAADAAIFDLLIKGLTQLVIVMAISGVVILPVARSISVPLANVGRAMLRVADQRYDVSVPHTNRPDEIGEIARTLSAFRTSLQVGERATRDAAFKGAAFEASSAALIVVRLDFTVLTVNAAFLRLLKEQDVAFAKLPAKPDPNRLLGLPLDDLQNDPGRIQGILSVPTKLPYRADVRVGEASFCLTFNLIEDAGGERLGYVVEWEDVTESRLIAATLAAIEANQARAEFDQDGKMIKANANFEAAIRCAAGDSLDDLLVPIDQGKSILGKLGTDEVLTGVFAGRSPDQRPTRLQGGWSLTGAEKAGDHRILFLGHDVTDVQADLAKAEARRSEMVQNQTEVMEALRASLRNLADGDLVGQIADKFPDEYEELRQDFNSSIDALRDTLGVVVDNACSIKVEATDISSATDKLVEHSETQSATLEETAASISHLSSAVQVASGGAQHAHSVVSVALENAAASDRVVEEAVAAMGEIETSSGQIGRIVSVIDDIAFQTNLLALNAGVEAARAGATGRGFAIVAAEVRALAQRSADAANEIRDLIDTSDTQVRKGARLVEKAGDALQNIVASVTDIATHMDKIATSAEEQSKGLSDIDHAMGALDSANQRNLAMFKETAAAARAMVRESMSLTHAVAQFRVVEEELGTSQVQRQEQVEQLVQEDPIAS